MCFAFFAAPVLVNMLCLLEEFVWILTLAFLMWSASCRRFLMRSCVDGISYRLCDAEGYCCLLAAAEVDC